MAEEQKPKARMVSEEDYLRLKVQLGEKIKGQNLTYEVKHGFVNHGSHLAPEILIRIVGGETTSVHHFALHLERLLLDFADKQQFVSEEHK